MALLLGVILLLTANSVIAADEATPGPIRYVVESRVEPRPLVIHRMTIDLQSPEFTSESQPFELAVAMGVDSDGDGPIEATLTRPMELAQREHFIAAINTNAWVMLPKPAPGKGNGYIVGGTADVSGWVRTNEATRSPRQPGHWSFWVDRAGRAFVDEVSDTEDVRCAVSGFRGLIKDGKILPMPSDVRHPRTAAGVDRDGGIVTLLVVDGRQPGYSEGVSEFELARLMAESDCDDALNLDGGGSTVMLSGTSVNELKVINRPSDVSGPRPIPVLLGLRRVNVEAR